MFHEVPAAVLQGCDVAAVARSTVTGGSDQPFNIGAPGRVRNVDVGVWPEGWQDASVERRIVGEFLVAGEIVQGIIRGGKDFDVEVLEQFARAEVGLRKTCRDCIEAGIRCLRAEFLMEAED